MNIVELNLYRDVTGQEYRIKTVDEASNAFFAADNIVRRLREHMDVGIRSLSGDVKHRDRMCADEYKLTRVCEPTACEYYKSFFSTAPGVCRSSKR